MRYNHWNAPQALLEGVNASRDPRQLEHASAEFSAWEADSLAIFVETWPDSDAFPHWDFFKIESEDLKETDEQVTLRMITLTRSKDGAPIAPLAISIFNLSALANLPSPCQVEIVRFTLVHYESAFDAVEIGNPPTVRDCLDKNT